MFISNMVVDVYREYEVPVSEYDISADTRSRLIYRDVPIHMTPFRPLFGTPNVREQQTTRIIANTRKNYNLNQGDILKAPQERREFKIVSVEPTGGAFIDNSIVMELVELDANH